MSRSAMGKARVTETGLSTHEPFSSLLETGFTQRFSFLFSHFFFFPIYISKTVSKVFHLKIHRLTSLKCMAEDLGIRFSGCS